MTYQTEFPDFEPATMPDIPATWIDMSWHNDACPCFAFFEGNEGDSNHKVVLVWIDYSEPANREFPEMPRYSITYQGGKGDCVDVLSTDDWSDVLAYVSARAELASRYVATVGYNPFLDNPAIDPDSVREMLSTLDDASGETFFSLNTVEDFDSFWQANGEHIDMTRERAFALACNCELLVGGGSAPLFRVGFVDSED